MTPKFVPLEKQTKRAQREARKAQRVTVGFNTGTRTHADGKHPSRAKEKARFQRERAD